MPTPRVLILRAPGTNCDLETAFAFQRAGGRPETLHVNQWLQAPNRSADFQILCIPGGFSYGDDIAAGRILANQLKHHLGDALRSFQESGKLVLGICNGFQVLLKAGAFFSGEQHGPLATLTWNESGKFEDRWIPLRTVGDRCVFLEGLEAFELPVAHAEGNFAVRDQATLQALDQAGQLALRYGFASGSADSENVPYPQNPNGSQGNVAGICDETGRLFGLMPHPERYIEPTHHPCWTRRRAAGPGDGLLVFRNAVRFFEI